MKKILYIDYDLQVGHVNFNRIQIDALIATGADVHLVLHQYMAEHLPYPEEMYDYIVPRPLRYRDGHPVINRMLFIITLLLIKYKINFKQYDNVVVGYCDELSLYTVPLTNNKYIFVHRTAGIYESSIKRWLYRRLARKNTFLVFNSHMSDMLEKAGITSFRIISHGCARAFDVVRHDTSVKGFSIFHPSSKINVKFVRDILNNTVVQRFLDERNVRLILKTCDGMENVKHRNIEYLPARISLEQYQQLFIDAGAILLSYPESFSGQVSGISYESVANKKRTMIFKHPSLEYCKQFYNYDPVFCDANDFVNLCKLLIDDNSKQCTATTSSLSPDYSFIK